MVGMWIAFFIALLGDRLGDVWQWVRDLPLVFELGLWLLSFPWLLGTAVWESSWAPWLRVFLVASFAIGWTLVSIPRAKDPRAHAAARQGGEGTPRAGFSTTLYMNVPAPKPAARPERKRPV
jgi:hypothetical protein